MFEAKWDRRQLLCYSALGFLALHWRTLGAGPAELATWDSRKCLRCLICSVLASRGSTPVVCSSEERRQACW